MKARVFLLFFGFIFIIKQTVNEHQEFLHPKGQSIHHFDFIIDDDSRTQFAF